MSAPYNDLSPGDPTEASRSDLVEGFARVIALDGGIAWLEPEQTTTCGGCAASGMCGDKGIGSIANRLERRRFPLPNEARLAVGERVVVGVNQRALITASTTAYALPLAAMLGAGGLAEWAAGSDGVTLVAMLAALAVGLVAARAGARRLGARGRLAPRFLRRAGVGDSCRTG